jgi:DNA-binding LacI/PurR family transcriptional regulator
MKSYVTLADVAKAAGLSVSTVSLCMRGHPRIPETTREQVLKVAEELGYRPNPMLASLAAYRQQVLGAKYQATIGAISHGPVPITSGKVHPYQLLFWEGAKARCAQLGFELEEFWLREPGMTAGRLSRILLARNINGLLLFPQARARSHLHLAWEHFSTVAFGHTLSRPQFHLVGTNHFHSGILAMRRLRALGYRRIGFMGVHQVIERTDTSMLGGYLVERERRMDQVPLPPLIMGRNALKRELFEAWYREHRPEAVLTLGFWSDILDQWMAEMGIDVPGELGLALGTVRKADGYAGIWENFGILGAKAIDQVKAMINSGEKGVPDVPLSLLVESSWCPGRTVRRINR